jgi:DNA-binding winged helix-turn-helix (wHTH) protein/tetratricopeptide (TPR) repeat protein
MSVYEFGAFCLDIAEHCLRQRDKLIDLSPRLLEVLRLLVENNGHLITKDELMRRVWHGAAVEDGNLTVSIFKLRKILGENTRTPKYIATIPRRGYRFIANVNRLQAGSASPRVVFFGQLRAGDAESLNVIQEHWVDEADSQMHGLDGSLRLSLGVLGSERVENSPAYKEQVKGRKCWIDHTREGLITAINHFQHARQLDSDCADAYIALVDCYLRLRTNYFLPDASNAGANGSTPVVSGKSKVLRIRRPYDLKSEWDRAILQRELRRAAELDIPFPDTRQWQSMYNFCQSLYQEAAMGRIAEERTAWTKPREPSRHKGLKAYRLAIDTTPIAAQISCIVARDQIEVGNIEAGYVLLRPWFAVGEWPRSDGLSPQASADLLFTAGVLAGRLANSRQLSRGQVHAEALLNGAVSLFSQLGLKSRVGECKSELGRCYDRQGMSDLARATLSDAINEIPEHEHELKSRAILRLAYTEMKMGHLHDSFARLNDVRSMALASPSTKHFFHIEMATTLGELAIAKSSDDYFNMACDHYHQAVVLSYAVGHHHRSAVLESNHGYLLLAFGKLNVAEAHLMRARMLFDQFSNSCPQLDETIARLHLETNRFDLAEEAVNRSIAALESCGEDGLLAESLRTRGQILCRLNRYSEARSAFDRAFHGAKACSDTEGAGLALLTMMEEMGDYLEDYERVKLAITTRLLLHNSQRISVLKRVRKRLPAAKALR